jgi:SAM-dependent methyltransferase
MNERVDYDRVAPTFDSRYERNNYSGVEQAVAAFLEPAPTAQPRVLEVGCGTGHWLRRFASTSTLVFGLDPSSGMLAVAREAAPGRLVRGHAEALPFADRIWDRLFCVNALHHFSDQAEFFQEASRVLRESGGLLTIGLDPHNGQDQWWIYDYFPSALPRDRERYLPTRRIRELMEAAGFTDCETRIVQHLPREFTVNDARSGGFLERTSGSQLMVIPDAEYRAGVERIETANVAAGGAKILRSDLRLYATVGWVGERSSSQPRSATRS